MSSGTRSEVSKAYEGKSRRGHGDTVDVLCNSVRTSGLVLYFTLSKLEEAASQELGHTPRKHLVLHDVKYNISENRRCVPMAKEAVDTRLLFLRTTPISPEQRISPAHLTLIRFSGAVGFWLLLILWL